MVLIWDYPKKNILKTEKGKILLLERMINNGIYLKDKQKISAKDIKKYWNKLKIELDRKKYLEFLLWENID